MRHNILIVIGLIVFVFIANNLTAYEKIEAKTIHLAKITRIDGYYCKGWITTAKDNRLISFDSAAPIDIKIGIIPSGSRIVLFSNLKVQSACLAKPTRIQGLPCLGYGPDSPPIVFYPNGRLKACHLQVDTWVQGIYCRHGSFSKVILNEDGKLFLCELAKTQVIQGQTIKSRSVVRFDAQGKITYIRKSNIIKSSVIDVLDKIM
jgi:hypothetical protein